jgi:phage-related protein (TIGR01555 family)
MPKSPRAASPVPVEVGTAAAAERMDEWASRVTGINTGADKRNSYRFQPVPVLTPEQADAMYNSNDLASLICSIHAEEALAEGIRLCVTAPDGADNEDGAGIDAKLMDRLDELQAVQMIQESDVFSNVHGDCFLYLGVEDGAASQAEPLDLSKVTKLNFLKVVERTQLSTGIRYNDTSKPQLFGRPQTYNVVSELGATSVVVHESRFIKMFGARTSTAALRKNSYWHFSALQRVQYVLRDFGITWDSAALLIQNASQGVYKLKDFLALLASKDGAATMEKRAQLVDAFRSAVRSIILDESESFEYQSIAFTGVPDMMDRFAARLATATGIPVSKLIGVAGGGLNATGEGDRRNWQARLRAYSRTKLKPVFDQLLKILAIELKVPEGTKITVEFCPLEQPTDAELAELRNKQAQTDHLYIQDQVLTPEEVAIARFPKGGYSTDTEIDLTLRKKIIETADEEAQQNPGDMGTVGARATAIMAVLDHVAAKQIPREVGVLLLQNLFGMTAEQADAQIGDVGDGFEPENQQAVDGTAAQGVTPGAKQQTPGAPAGAGAKPRGVPRGVAAAKPRLPSARKPSA